MCKLYMEHIHSSLKIYAFLFCQSVTPTRLCTTCVAGACGNQKGTSDTPELSHHVGAGPLQEQQVLLAAEPSLQT